MPLAKKTKSAKGNQGAQWSRGSGDGGNVKYLPGSGGTDTSGMKPRTTGKKGREIARTGK